LIKNNGINEERVTVGTIHTFQGSERDIIIWDIVDTPQNDMGLLYKGETGERLVNVAISRAKSRLVIVGYPRTFHESKANDLVSINIKTLISKAWNQYKKSLGVHINY
jgi:superfamily I DNA and/or RNA helicase